MRQLKINKSITNRDGIGLDKYLQEIGREELITVGEEVELAQRIKKGDQKALDKLVRANLRFVAQQDHQGGDEVRTGERAEALARRAGRQT